MPAHRNISFATAEGFDAVLKHGADVSVRGKLTKELRNRVTTIELPRERCVFLPRRANDVFAQVAEAMWVIGGRNDLPWLTRYLPRAPLFSDDEGATWHGAYGPRLRSWNGIDQLAEWRRLLTDDVNSRRVVGVLFDPKRDFVASNDIPCNNWLSWIIRDGKLHLNVGLRSNDALWGFSGANAFEWSVLQEMLAFWTHTDVGDATYFATSYHLYADRFRQAENVVQRFFGVTPYDSGIAPPAFRVPWDDFDATMRDWFAAEDAIARDPSSDPGNRLATSDPFLASSLRLLQLKWGSEVWSDDELANRLAALPEDDFAAAAYEFFGRKLPALRANAPQPGIKAFFAACLAANDHTAADLKAAVQGLHDRKNTGYADAWKRRGELVSVLPNIARKVDRLAAFADQGQQMDGETVLDTAIDLLVYTAKYRLFLAEQVGADRSLLPSAPAEPFSSHRANFDHLIDNASFASADVALDSQIGKIAALFDAIWRAAERSAALIERQRTVNELFTVAAQLVGSVIANDPQVGRAFITHELRLARKN